jgi:hypothetical protein
MKAVRSVKVVPGPLPPRMDDLAVGFLYRLTRPRRKAHTAGTRQSGTPGPSVTGCPRNTIRIPVSYFTLNPVVEALLSVETEPCHLVARRVNLPERLPEPVGIILLPLRPSQVVLLVRVVVEVV